MPILELKEVRYSYSPEKVVLRGMSCAFECGTLAAFRQVQPRHQAQQRALARAGLAGTRPGAG